ncbi:MAG: glutathione S-transferase N-terminal domain-containing protein [Myxococcota bacterium]
MAAGAQKAPEILALNPMGKVPVLVDGDVVVTEVAAIGLYLADRYAPGRLAPALDDPARGAYLRWSLFAPSRSSPARRRRPLAGPTSRARWGGDARGHPPVEAAIATAPAARRLDLPWRT